MEAQGPAIGSISWILVVGYYIQKRPNFRRSALTDGFDDFLIELVKFELYRCLRRCGRNLRSARRCAYYVDQHNYN